MEDADEQSADKKKMKLVKYSSVVAETDTQLVDPKDARIRHLERQNYLLRRIVDAQKDYASERENFTSSYLFGQSDNTTIHSFSLLPNIVLKQILQQIPDQQTLLHCRLVNVEWNQLIENTSKLMKKITFPIWHPKLFMDLDIVKKKKVKSIKLTNPTQLYPSSENNTKFIDFITENIEKVEFAFEDPDLPYRCEVFELILEKCDKLQELVINCTNSNDDSLEKIFRSASLSTINIAAVNTLSIVSIRVLYCYEREDAAGLSMFLLKLPNLQEIIINGICPSEVDVEIITALCEYIKNYETKLHLKKLTLAIEEVDFQDETDDELNTLLLILCGEHKIIIDDSPTLNFNSLLEFTGSAVVPLSMLQRRPLLANVVYGDFRFMESNDNLLPNFDRLQFLDVENLNLTFERTILKSEEIGWIKQVQGLEYLSMEIIRHVELLPISISMLKELFSAGFTSLEKLRLTRDVFGSLDRFPWLQTFSDLNNLIINDYTKIPSDLISQLTVLESLTKLKLESLENLVDESFTIECINRFATDNGSGLSSTAPAIACFKELKVLEIYYCNKLTEVCLSEGITKSNTLEIVRIIKCSNLKENCSNLMKCKCQITVLS